MNNIVLKIKDSNSIVILCHTNPDGDAVGSSLGLYLALKKLNKDVDVVIKDVPKKYSYLVGYNNIKLESDKKYDVAIVLDTAVKDRINSLEVLNNVHEIIVIDHHISNENYGNLNYVKNVPACVLNVYNLVHELDIEIDNNIGEALYTGLLTDTNAFSNGNVDTLVFSVAMELSKIIDTQYIYRKAIGTITKEEFELRKIAIKNLEFYANNAIAYSDITIDEINSIGGTVDECSSLVNIARDIIGVEVSIFTRIYENTVRVSLRSNNPNINVNVIASKFGGGGHVCAAGILLDNIDYNEFKEELISEVSNIV